MNLRLKKILAIPVAILLLLLILFFSFRNVLLNWGIAKASGIVKQKSGAILTIHSSSFTGISGVSLGGITIVPQTGDTILHVDTAYMNISLWTLLSGTIRLNEVNSSGVQLIISCRDSVCNYSSFLREKHEPKETLKGEKNYSALFKRLLDRVFNLAPQKASLKDVSLVYRNDTLERKIRVIEFHSDEAFLEGTAEDDQIHTIWKCNGKFSQAHHSINLNVFHVSGSKPFLPLLNELFGLTTGFDSLTVALNGYHLSRDVLTATGRFSINDFSAFHKRISDDTVKVSSGSFDFTFHAGKNYIELDSNSTAALSSIHFNPYMRYLSDSSKEYSLSIKTEKVQATDFMTSLPSGMFDEVREITADGTLKFEMFFRLNSSVPDSVQFETSLKKEKFRIRKTGSFDLMKMNYEFPQTVYERNVIVRSFLVGPGNPFYTPLENASPNFINAVLTSEDGSFFYHNGFNEEAFRKSIAANFKAGKFVRGGSTISMQLVKNVFLTRKKTIARKAEEALLVWLIESNRLYSKERMLEVYINIIELGPGVYGVGEASDFYFKKKPAELTLPEGIFLASLLPHPKWFKYSFDTLGNLKPYLASYYRIVSDFMLRKNLITQEEHDSIQPVVTLVGPAREMVVPSDTLLELEEPHPE